MQSVFCTTNELYGNDKASPHKLAKGYTRLAVTNVPVPVPHEVLDAHKHLIAKQTLNNILRSKAIVDRQIKGGDLVQLYIKKSLEERGTWTITKPVFKYDPHFGTVTIAGEHGKCVEAVIEDGRHAMVHIPCNFHAAEVQYEVRDLTGRVHHTLSRSVRLSWKAGWDT